MDYYIGERLNATSYADSLINDDSCHSVVVEGPIAMTHALMMLAML